MKPGTASSISLVLVSVVLLLSLFLTVSPPAAKAQAALPPPATLSIFSEDTFSNNITNANLKPGSTFVIDVRADNLAPIMNSTDGGVSAIDITVNYDFHILKATGIGYSAGDTPTCPSADTCLWDGLPVQVYAKRVDSPPGSSRLAMTSLGASNPANRIQGSGILFRIQFKVVGSGYTNIIFDTSINPPLVGPLGSKGTNIPLPYKTVNGSFDNTPLYILFTFPASGRVLVGRSIATNVTAFMETGGPQNVSLSASGLPTGATASFKPSFGITTFTSRLNITTSATTPPGNYTVKVTGLCPGCVNGFDFTEDGNFTLSVIPPFTLSVTPHSGKVLVGLSVATNVTASMTLGGLQNVSLSASGLPSGTTATFTPSFGITTFTSRLNITTASTTPTGNYTVRITGQCTRCVNGLDFTENINFLLSVNRRNLAVLSVTPSTTAVDIGHVVSVSVTVKNEGTQVEMFTVNLFANTTIGASQSVTLRAGASQSLTVNWNTSTFNPGTYNVTAQIPLLSGETNVTDNIKTGGNVKLGFPDVGVTSVTTTTSVVKPGQTVSVSITVVNQGLSSQTFTVNLSVKSSGGVSTQVGSLQVTSLPAGQSTTISTSWSTSGFSADTYTLHASIPSLQNETNLVNNSLDGNTVRINALPLASFTITTAAPTVGQDVNFDASQSSDSDGTIASYSWSFGDGGTGSGRTVTHKYATQGTYTVTLTVTDNDGGSKATSQTVSVANALPVASFTITTTAPTAGQDVNFDASQSSDSDGTITNYSWNFGDGATDSGNRVTHKYQTEGTYTVTLTVKDNDGGTNTMTQTVNVAAAPSHAPVLTSPLGLTGIAAVVVLVILVALLLARRRGRRNKP